MKKFSLQFGVFVALASSFPLFAGNLYWDADGATLGAGVTPNGIWGTDAFWSTDATGASATGAWLAGETAVFSAGSTATGAYTVTVSGTQTAGGLVIKDGTIAISTGAVALGSGAIQVNAGATLSTDSNARITTTTGSTLALNGGTLRSTNAAANGTFFDTDTLITLGAAGGTFSYTTAGFLNIVQDTLWATVVRVTGPGGLAKAGAGVLAIAALTDYTGPTIISEGELRIRTTANRLPITTDVTVSSGAVLNLNGVAQQIGSLSGSGNVGTGAAILTISGPTSTTFDGALKNIANAGASGVTSGNGRLVKDGAGVITFNGQNDIRGSVTVNGGGIIVSSTGSLCGTIADIAINNTGFITLNNTAQTIENLAGTAAASLNLNGTNHILSTDPIASTTFAGTISGPGGITKLNANATKRTLTLSGANTYDGITTISAGNIAVGSATGLGSTVGYTEVASGAEVLFTGVATNFTVAEPMRIAGIGNNDAGAIAVISSASPTLTGPITLTGDATITVSSSASATFTGSITALANQNLTLTGGANPTGTKLVSGSISLGSGGITKSQGGQWTLSGTNTYSGNTNITGGTLLLGSDTALSATTSVSLSGGTLKTGAFNGTTSGSLMLTANSIIDFSDTSSVLTFANNVTGTWTGILSIWNWGGGVWASGGAERLMFTNSTLTAAQLGTIQFYSDGGTTRVGVGADFLAGTNGELVAVPEPAAFLAGGLLLGLMGYRERRKLTV